MPDINTVLTDPRWLPHLYDPRQNAALFAEISAEQREALTFLADFKPASEAQAQWIPAQSLVPDIPGSVPMHFLFHSAFCRSTLLVQALGALEALGGLSEPAIFNSMLAQASDPKARAIMPALLAQLAKPMAQEQAVIAKPSNFANGLIAPLLKTRTASKGILLYGSLEAFLKSVAKKGFQGRIWARKQLAHNRKTMPLDLGLDENAHYELTDLQCAALAWLLQMQQFAQLLKALPDQLCSLDTEAFMSDKAGTIAACARWYGAEAPAEEAAAIASGPLFASHAKQGGDYAAVKAEQDAASASKIVDEEITQVAQWVDVIMQQLGLKPPLASPLPL